MGSSWRRPEVRLHTHHSAFLLYTTKAHHTPRQTNQPITTSKPAAKPVAKPVADSGQTRYVAVKYFVLSVVNGYSIPTCGNFGQESRKKINSRIRIPSAVSKNARMIRSCLLSTLIFLRFRRPSDMWRFFCVAAVCCSFSASTSSTMMLPLYDYTLRRISQIGFLFSSGWGDVEDAPPWRSDFDL